MKKLFCYISFCRPVALMRVPELEDRRSRSMCACICCCCCSIICLRGQQGAGAAVDLISQMSCLIILFWQPAGTAQPSMSQQQLKVFFL